MTFLTPVSLGSLNGSDKEADNLSSIKKLTRGTKTFPYVSSQAIRRALRDQLGVLGHTLSEGQIAKEKKGAAITRCLPAEFIDDDLFGFMDATKGGTHKRTSPVRVSPLLALDPYEGDIDFGTNYMSVEAGGDPVARVAALLSALQHLWSSGRQSRFLTDISPKFVAAAILSAKLPIFLESVRVSVPGRDLALDLKAISEALEDSKKIELKHCFGVRSGLFAQVPEGSLTVGQAFDTILGWVKDHYGA
jgi:CRISPR-associated protein Cst2